MVKLIGVPPEWKVHQHRVKCLACGSEQWSKTNVMPIDHHRPDGRVCRKETRRRYTETMKEIYRRIAEDKPTFPLSQLDGILTVT
jgi:hypothetical protein